MVRAVPKDGRSPSGTDNKRHRPCRMKAAGAMRQENARKEAAAIRPPLPGNQRLSPANAAGSCLYLKTSAKTRVTTSAYPANISHDSDHPPTIASGVDCE